jgi:hypothetical protein
LSGSTSLTFTITNPNSGIALTGLAFTDNLPAGLVVATPNGLVNSGCGGTATAVAGSGSVSLSAGTLASSGSCTIVVNVTGTTSGVKNNVSGAVNSTEGGPGNTASASVTVVAPPTVSKAFGAATIPLNGTTSLTLTIANPNTTVSLTGIAVTDNLPAGLVVATPNGQGGTCTGTITDVAGSSSVSLTGGSLGTSGTCTITLNVTGTTAGVKNNTTGTPSSNEGGTGVVSNTATVTVVAPVTITKAFGAANIALNGSTSLTLTLTNPSTTVTQNAIAVTDTLPAGLVVATPNGLGGTCTGTITAVAGSGSVSLTGGSLAASASCTIIVNVTGTTSGAKNNTTGAPSSTEGGTGVASNTATVTVASPPSISKAFGAATIPLNGSTTLTFTITNPNSNVALTGIAFTDNLPGGLTVATPNGLVNTGCGGTPTATAGSSSVSLSAGTLATSGSCTIVVNVTGTTAGVKNNVTTAVTSTEGGPGNTASANVTVVSPPGFSKAFGATSIPLNGSTTLVFTIQNANPTTTQTGIAFSDTLPAGLVVGTNGAITCTGAGALGGTVTAVTGSSSISLSGLGLLGLAQCTITVNVNGTAAGTKLNVSGAISSTEGGTGTTASASIDVVAPPTISKAFGAANISINGTTSLTISLTNPAANGVAETGVAFTDPLPAGLVVATPNGLVNTCGGTPVAVAGSSSMTLTSGTIAVNSTCTLTINVTGTSSGIKINTTGPVSSTNGGTGTPSNTATVTVAAPPTITKAFGAASIPVNGSTSLTFTITNPNATVSLSGIAFTDTLPAGLVVATPNGLVNTGCGGTATAVAGSGSVSLSAGTLAASGSCTVTVNVTGTTAGVKNNSVQVTSTEGGTGNTSNASITVVAPPVIIKAFGAASIPLSGTTTLQFTIQNNNTTTTLTGVGFGDTLPGGLVISTPNGLTGNTCGATPTAVAGSNSVSLAGGSIAASSTCTFTINVTGTAAGTQNNTTGNVTSTEGGTGGTASASIDVVAPPSIAKAFGAANIPVNGTTTLTFTITNPAGTAVTQTGVAFTDTLPANIVVATPNGLSNTCGGTATAVAGSGSITLTGGSIAAGSNCTVVVNVTGTAAGNSTNVTGNVSSTNGGTGNTATANLIVAAPPAITKSFGVAAIPLGGSTSLTFSINNPNASIGLTGIAFTDNLPAGLVVASPNALTSTCGGTATAVAGSGAVTLSGGTTAASASCTITVNVTGTTAGVKNNSTQVTSTEGGTGNTTNASITVVSPPVIIKQFGAASISLNGTTTLQFTIQNNNTTTTLTGVGFGDTLPAGLVVATPNGLTGNTCSTTPTAVAGSNSISLSGTSLAASTSCTFFVNVTGTTAGTKTNVTGNVTSTEGGTGGTATASIDVVAPPSIQKAFGAAAIPLNGTTSLTFTITNPASNGVAEAGVAFTDNLPAGLVVATPNGLTNTCGGTATAVAGSGSVTLTGGTIAVNSTCTITVNVTGTASGNFTNSTGNVSSTNGGTGNTATANLSVATPPTITKSFGAASIPLNGSTSLTFTITNPAANTIPLTGVAFTDTLPAGLVVATPNGLTSTCGGTATATAGSGSVSLSAGTLAVNTSCTLSVNVTGTVAGAKNNSVQVTSTEGGPGNTSNASITVVAPPVLIKAFGAASIPLNGTTTLQFTIQNNNTTTTLTGIGFGDTLPAGLVVATPNGLAGNTCSTTPTAVAGSNSVSLSGASLNQSTQCQFTINVTGTAGGTKNNVAGPVTSTEGGTGGTASASIDVVAPPSIVKAFGATGIPLNGTTSLTLTITNPAANGIAEAGVAVTDNLPAGLVVATPNGLTNTCGGTATATAGSGTITLTGGTVAASSSCTVTVNVTGTVSGNYTNTTGAVSSTNGGTGNTASANLSVAAPPSITKSFGAATIPQNGSTSLSFTITNPVINTIPLTVAFTDTLPAGLVVATPNGLTNTCGGTVTATAGSGSVSLSGGTVAINSNCKLTVNITGTTAGVKNNSVQVTSTQGGPGNTSNASITVVAPPSIIKAFGVTTLAVGSTTSLTLTISNPNAAVTLTGVAVTDNMPFGLNVDVPGGATNTCGGTATVSPHSFSLSGGTLAPSGSCTVTVTVRAVAGGGTRVNTTGNVTSANGGTGNTATASINVPGPPLNIALTVTGGGNITINPGDTATFVFTVNSGDPALGGINFSCNTPLPAGATCTFDSQGETQGTAQVTLSFTTTGPSAPTKASNQPQPGRGTAPLYAALLVPFFGLVQLARRGKKGKSTRLRLALWLGGLIVLAALVGCGGGSSSLLGGNGNGGTPPGLYPITVTATSSANPSITATTNVSVTVR